VRRRWWWPAAATSTARRALPWPMTSARSGTARSSPVGGHPAGVAARQPAGTSGRGGAPTPAARSSTAPVEAQSVSSSPRSSATTWASEVAPSTCMSGTRRASPALAAGTTTRRTPASCAASTAGRTPRTGRTAPSSPSSPSSTSPSITRSGRRPSAASTATATGRSKWVPRFGMEAGERLTVIRCCGQGSPEQSTAARTRSRASARAVSGSPTRTNPGMPPMCTSTWTRCPCTPTSATHPQVASRITPLLARARRPARPAGG
jgi:hypothetical protein